MSKELIAAATQVADHGITVNVGDDGAWVCFKSKAGKSFCFQPIQEWGNGNFATETIREWANDMQVLRAQAAQESAQDAADRVAGPLTEALVADIIASRYGRPLVAALDLCRELEAFAYSVAPPAPESEALELPVSIVDIQRGFDYSEGMHTPWVKVTFSTKDWDSREKFVEWLDILSKVQP